jgi:argininosuccinate synthase
MTEIKKDNLEKALADKKEEPQLSKEMEIGFHQGALNTLVNERNELFRLIQQVEQIMQAHIKRLEDMGVKIKTSEKQ